ncbi:MULTISPECIES: 2OG-Fe dioxygenase family protein [Campylobacter]|nr:MULTISPECIES: 2OG-Fe dioxygenase family protein [Campylobacter]
MSKIAFPITIVDCIDIGLDLGKIQNKLQSYYDEYEDDLYLLHKNKIDYISKFMKINNDEIYKNINFDFSSINLDSSILKTISLFKSNRKRLISKYIIDIKNENFKIERIPANNFLQSLAFIADEKFDYRKSERKFKELPDNLFDCDLRAMLKFTSFKIGRYIKKSKFAITVHHTFIFCENGRKSTNSPEGIHQDGMDFIMSAFVIDRQNINGAKSIIYKNDKKTKIFETILKNGQGIIQPDLNSGLWHEVTEISQININEVGYRSSIGFDIEVLE